MKKLIKLIIIIVAIFFSLAAIAVEVYDMSDSIYNKEVSSSDLNAVQDVFPEYQTPDSSYISSITDPNLYFSSTGDLSVTFIDEGAGYRNSFGYFSFDENNNIIDTYTIFSNASETYGGGTLNPGDTVDLGSFDEGENIGFWLQANGYNNPNGNIYYTIDELNPDGLRHIAIVEIDESIYIGIEDLYNLGDEDYNDIIFKINVTPYESIDSTHIPGNPAPQAAATALISIFSLAILFFKKWGYIK